MTKKVVIIVASVVGMILLVGGGGLATFALLNNSRVGDAIRDAVGERTYEQSDVDAALLTAADLPGYAQEPSDPGGDGGTDLTPCGKSLELSDVGRAGTDREATFSKGELGPFVLHLVGLLEDGATLEPIRAVFRDCPNWTQDGEDYTAAAADYGEYGDETYSTLLTINSEGIAVQIGSVFIRQGNLLSVVLVAAFPSVTDDDVREPAEKAADKLP